MSAEPHCLPWIRISLPRHDPLRKDKWPISQRRRTRSLFLSGLSLGLICIGIQGTFVKQRKARKQTIEYKFLM